MSDIEVISLVKKIEELERIFDKYQGGNESYEREFEHANLPKTGPRKLVYYYLCDNVRSEINSLYAALRTVTPIQLEQAFDALSQ